MKSHGFLSLSSFIAVEFFQMKFVIALLFLGVSVNAAPSIQNGYLDKQGDLKAESPNYILDRTFLPENYTIELKTYLAEIYNEEERFIFNGKCVMNFKYVGEKDDQNNFTIHAKNLNQIEYELFEVLADGSESKILFEVSVPNVLTDKVEFKLTGNNVFKRNTLYVLKSKYNGQMDDDMHGFYKSRYEDDKGNIKYGSF